MQHEKEITKWFKNTKPFKNTILRVQQRVLYSIQSIDFTKEETLKGLTHKETKEVTILFASFFTHTVYKINTDFLVYNDFSKKLWSKILQSLYSDYKVIINILIKHYIIEEYKSYRGGKSTEYRLTEPYREDRIRSYKITQASVKKKYKSHLLRKLSSLMINPIIKNDLLEKSRMIVPTEEQLLEYANRLILNNIKVKGKVLKMSLQPRDKNNDKKKKKDNVYYVLSDIKKFLSLNNEDTIYLPFEIHGRVYTCFDLQARWVKDCIDELNGYKNSDYQAFYPNICISHFNHYEPEIKYITHQKVDGKLQVMSGYGYKYKSNIESVKKQHLSFFNEDYKEMHKYNVFNYYKIFAPNALGRLMLFNGNVFKEVCAPIEGQIQCDVANQLLELNITGRYDFDGWHIKSKDYEAVKDIMNQTTLKHNIYTTVS